MTRVLIIEDEPSYVQALQVALGAEGFEVVAALDGKEGLERFRATPPELILLDLMLPGLSGLDVLREVRRLSDVPVIVVSAKGAEADIVSALELGADDYVTKPFSPRELRARIQAVLRRVADVSRGTYRFGDCEVDYENPKQRFLAFVKRTMVRLDLMPKTMAGKKLFKRLVFGRLIPLPAELTEGAACQLPCCIDSTSTTLTHKVIFAVAHKKA